MIQTKNTYKQKEFYFSCANLYNIFEHWEVSLAYDFQWNTLDATFYMPTESDGTFPFPTRYTHMAALATAFEWGRLKMQASVLGYFVQERSSASKPGQTRLWLPRRSSDRSKC